MEVVVNQHARDMAGRPDVAQQLHRTALHHSDRWHIADRGRGELFGRGRVLYLWHRCGGRSGDVDRRTKRRDGDRLSVLIGHYTHNASRIGRHARASDAGSGLGRSDRRLPLYGVSPADTSGPRALNRNTQSRKCCVDQLRPPG
jgi:hypothetical protein